MTGKYKKKPVVIEAIKYTGNNFEEIIHFCNSLRMEKTIELGVFLVIKTLEGEHVATPGDYIIKGVKGEFYPCKPDIFEMTYEKVE